jgi:creatinine amidohydrolase
MIDERRVALASMTSPEAAEALAKAEVALLPVGATEQHGPNMSLETDTVVAYRLALRIAAAAYPRAIVAPPLPYGVSYHHMSFPGTMTLSPETFQAVVLEVVEERGLGRCPPGERGVRPGPDEHRRRALGGVP